MKIFVTGSNGFLGRAVTSELAQRGHHVIGLLKPDDNLKPIDQPGVSYIKGDLLESGEWCDRIKEVDKVISLTNPMDIDEDIPKDKVDTYSRMHTESVGNLIKAASEGKAKTIITTYYTDCYGDRQGKWVTDADAIEPIGFCRPLADVIKTADKLAEETELSIVRVFPAMVYGNGGWFKKLVEHFRSSGPKVVKPGDNYINLIHIADLAGLYASITEKIDRNDVFILSDDRPVIQSVLMSHVATLMGLPKPQVVDFETYAKEFGWLLAESISSNTRVPGLKAIDTLGYAMKARSYEKGMLMTLKSMGVETHEEVMEEVTKAA